MVYSLPMMRSGCGGGSDKNVNERENRARFRGNIVAHRHVFGRPCESARTRAYELAGNAKVAKLDYALPRKEDVRGFDISVDDLLGMQVCEALQDLGFRRWTNDE